MYVLTGRPIVVSAGEAVAALSADPIGRAPIVSLRSWFANVLQLGGEGERASRDAVDGEGGPNEGGVAVASGAVGDEQASGPSAEPAPDSIVDIPSLEVEEPQEPRWWAPEGVSRTKPEPPVLLELSAEARALENLLVSHFDGHNLTLPRMPHVAERVLQRLHDAKCELSAVATDVAEDRAIAGDLIRIVNSPIYRGVNRITALQPAVVRLGTNAIRTLMMHQSLRAATILKKGGDRELASMVWYRSLADATVMRLLAAFTEVEPEDAFLMGLLHDVGNLIVLRTVEEQRAMLGYDIDVETFEYLCTECHQEFGELIAEAWKLPPSLRALITDHHSYPAPDDALRTERLLLILTEMISGMLGYGPPVAYALLESHPVRDLGLSERADFVAFLERLPDELEETLASFGLPAGARAADADGEDPPGLLKRWLATIRRGRAHDKGEVGRRHPPR